jgi:hypothetical protein
VLDDSGCYTFLDPLDFTVKNGPQTLPIGAVSSPTNNATVSGIITVSGDVYSPGGRVTLVAAVVDGRSVLPVGR